MFTDNDFKKLLDHYNMSWRGYRKVRKGVMKRIRHHMAVLQCETVEEYIDRISQDRAEEGRVQAHLRVTISRFCRDRHLWRALSNEIIPSILQTEEQLTIWSAGCSCGEEVYSFKIIWNERFSLYPPAKIIATDANQHCLERAKAGIYRRSSLRELPDETIRNCFTPLPDGDRYAIKPQFKDNIVWREHNFLSAPISEQFHMIFLRNNLLTYHNPAKQAAALNKILSTLLPGGYLIIGSHEQLPELSCSLIQTASCDMIFRICPKS